MQLSVFVATHLAVGDCITLQGELGAGKSTLARTIIHSLTGEKDVPSPTFTLVQAYEAPGFTLWHYDLYRLTHPGEMVELAIDEALQQGVCLIEWPEIAMSLLPSDQLAIHILSGPTDEQRIYKIEGSPSWQQRWQQRTLRF